MGKIYEESKGEFCEVAEDQKTKEKQKRLPERRKQLKKERLSKETYHDIRMTGVCFVWRTWVSTEMSTEISATDEFLVLNMSKTLWSMHYSVLCMYYFDQIPNMQKMYWVYGTKPVLYR